MCECSFNLKLHCLPSVDVVEVLRRCRRRMYNIEVVAHPFYKVIFKSPLYYLMEEVWRNKFIDVGAGEVVGKRLELSQLVLELRNQKFTKLYSQLSLDGFRNSILHQLDCHQKLRLQRFCAFASEEAILRRARPNENGI